LLVFSIYTAADLAVGMQVVNVTSMVSRQPIVQLFACTCNSFLSHKSLGVDTTRRSKGDAPQPLNGLAPTLQQPITPHAGISHGIDQSQSTLQMHGSAAYEQENLLIITDEGLTAFDLPMEFSATSCGCGQTLWPEEASQVFPHVEALKR
jgi:hypothetical protein